jgi:hypothetical protein
MAEETSKLIRDAISKLPTLRLRQAKPSDIFPSLEGVEITPSVRSMTSKLLSDAKRKIVFPQFIYDDVSSEEVMAAIAILRGYIGKQGKIDIYDRDLMRRYYDQIDAALDGTRKLYDDQGRQITVSKARKELLFEDIAENMKVIGADSKKVIVIKSDTERTIRSQLKIILNWEESYANKHRAHAVLQEFTVSLFDTQIENLREKGYIEDYLLDPTTGRKLEIYCYKGPYNPLYGIPVALAGKGAID